MSSSSRSSSSSQASAAPPITSGPAGSGFQSNDPSFVTGLYGGPSTPSDMERRRASLVVRDRKRRLTATGNDDETPRTEGTFGGADLQRPLPTLPSGGDRTSNVVAGSSFETTLDVLSSPSLPPPPPARLLRQHSQSSPTRPAQNDHMEYSLPRWQPDNEVKNCPICGTQFNFWYRKHHCRKCGRVVCSSCSPHRITIPRQYIVRPPEHSRRLSAVSTPPVPGAGHLVQTADLTGGDVSQSSPYRQDDQPLNPALGGGEEVRLCNPCVPDPNPDPPLGYDTVRSGQSRMSHFNWAATLPALPSSHPLHRAHHSVSEAHVFDQRSDVDHRYRRRTYMGEDHRNEDHLASLGQLSSSRGSGHVVPSPQGYPSRYGQPFDSFPPAHSPPAYSAFRPRSVVFSTHQSGPAGTNFRDAIASSSRTRPSRVHSLVDPERPRHPFRSRVPIDERDICPICSQALPPRGSDGNEEAREAHIRDCIEGSARGGRSPPPGSPSRPPHPMRMLLFTATEKDCVNEDGSPQECTICMEEYEVGDALSRLECLCKFHKSCIVEWFERKKECPVHRLT